MLPYFLSCWVAARLRDWTATPTVSALLLGVAGFVGGAAGAVLTDPLSADATLLHAALLDAALLNTALRDGATAFSVFLRAEILHFRFLFVFIGHN